MSHQEHKGRLKLKKVMFADCLTLVAIGWQDRQAGDLHRVLAIARLDLGVISLMP